MAPPKADTGRAIHGNTKRATPVMPRIVPAVPLAYSRPLNASKAKNGVDHATEKVSSPVHDDVNGKAAKAAASPESIQTLPDTNGSEETASDAPTPVVSEPPEPVIEELPEEQKVSTNELELEEKPPPRKHAHKISTTDSRIPYELPPPFYPADSRSTPTPTSATSSATPPNPPTSSVTMQHPQPKANHIVFGGYADSSNVSPAPPFQGHPHPHPDFIPANFPPPFFPAHSHHLSDPRIGSMYPPMGPPPPPNVHGYRGEQPPNSGRQQQQWFRPDGAQYNGVYPQPFPPHNGVTHHSRSPSQASSRTQDHDPQRNEIRHQHHVQPMMNGFNSPAHDPRSIAAMFHLHDWLSSQVDNPEFADYMLEISYSSTAEKFLIPVHGIIVARSPTLRALLPPHGPAMLQPQGPKLIKITVPTRYFNSDSYKDALRSLYGAPLLGNIGMEPLPPFDLETRESRRIAVAQDHMDRALAYLAAGHFLGDPAVLANGTDIVTSILRWDTIEKALGFVLDRTFTPSISPRSSQSDAFSTNGTQDPSILAFFDMQRERLFQNIIGFLAKSIPSDFKVNTTAPQMASSPLLPEVESRPNKHRAQLSQIRFGELQPDASNTVIFITNLASTILFSLPFPILKRLFEDPTLESRLGHSALAGVATATVEERESRRKKVARSSPNQEVVESLRHLWQNTLYEERVEASNQTRSGFQISRQIDSRDTPVENGSHKP